VRLLIALLPVAGCHRVFGISGEPADAPIDAPPSTVHGTMSRTHVSNGQLRAPVQMLGPLTEMDRPTASIDGAPLDVAWDLASGNFTFEVPEGSTYRLRFRQVEYVTSSLEPDVSFVQPGRIDNEVPTEVPKLAVKISSPVVLDADTIYIAATGSSWAQLAVNPVTLTATYAWENGNGPLPLLDAGKNDQLYAYRFRAQLGSTLATIFDVGTANPVMTPTGTTNTSVTLETIDPHCLNIDVAAARRLARLGEMFPHLEPYTAGYFLLAVPAPSLGTTGGLTIGQDLSRMDKSEQITFVQPFLGHTVVLRALAQRLNPATNGFVSTDTLHVIDLPAAGCASHEVLEAPLVRDIRIDGRDLAVPKIELTSTEPTIKLSWTLVEGSRPAQRYMVRLLDEKLATQMTWITTEPQVTIDRADVTPGVLYHLEVQVHAGIPEAALAHFQLPIEYPLLGGTTRTELFSITW
jgi:hypothetical protein